MHMKFAGQMLAASLLFGTLLGGAASAQEGYPERAIEFIAQSGPGSGLDTITRAVATTLQEEGLVAMPMPVTNIPTSAAIQTVVTRHDGDAYMLSFQSSSAMIRFATGLSEYSHENFTPIARLVSDYYMVLVRPDSEFQDLGQVLEALKADPRAFPIVGGPTTDRMFLSQLLIAAGIDPTQVNYVAMTGGSESSALLLEGSAKLQISSLGDVSGMLLSDQLRALAISSGERLEGDLAEVPTLIESGVNIQPENLRYALMGPNAPPEAVAYWQGKLAEMVQTPTWKRMLEQHQWGDTFLIEGLGDYLDTSQEEMVEIAKLLGMTGQ